MCNPINYCISNTWYVMTLVKHMPNLTIICEIFGANLVPKLKIVNLSWSLVSTLIRRCRTHLCFSGFPFFEYAEFSGGIYFFYFRPKITLLSKCGPKNPNCQFKLKLVTYYHFHEILRLFHGWANMAWLLVKNWYLPVAPRVAERRKIEDLSKLENIRKISKLQGFYCLVLSPLPKMKVLSVLVKISWKTEIELFP